MLDNYKKTYEDIKVPEGLLKKTSAMMKAEQEKQQKHPFFSKKWLVALAGSFVIVIAIATTLMNQNTGPIISKLSDDKTVEEVALEDGKLRFSNDLDLADKSLQLGNVHGQKEGTIKDAKAFFKKNVVDNKPNDMKLTNESVLLYYNEQDVIKNVLVNQTFKDADQTLILTYTSGKSTSLNTNSRIKDITLDIRYDEDAVYTAKFKLQDVVYKVVAKNMTQKEFIMFLYNFVS